MTVYEREMIITIKSEEWNETDVRNHKISAYLYEEGLALMESYSYATSIEDIDEENYGYRTKVNTTKSYNVFLNDKLAMTFNYRFKANDIVAELKRNGFDATQSVTTTTTEQEQWMPMPGEYMFAFFDGQVGTMKNDGTGLKLHYENDIMLTCRLTSKYNGNYDLSFRVTKEVESITDRKQIEKSLVEVPASDMKTIRQLVFQALGRESLTPLTHVLDCETKVLSEVNYHCSTDSIDLVMGDEEE